MFYDIDRSTHERNIERLEGENEPESETNALDGGSMRASARVS
jgi:hypothetical protein